jgi:hypothetical protein
MMRDNAISPRVKLSAWCYAIFSGGMIAGVLDIISAFIDFGWQGTSPVRVLQAIASGLLGATSFEGGWSTAALGALLHFLIAFAAAAVYVGASRKLRFLIDQAFIAGVLYGAVVYLAMTFVVIPLSRCPFAGKFSVKGLLVHIFLIGLPIALSARHYSKRSDSV